MERWFKVDTDYYISEISKMSNRFGDKLANMMKRYGKTNLREITYEEAKEFYGELINNGCEPKQYCEWD